MNSTVTDDFEAFISRRLSGVITALHYNKLYEAKFNEREEMTKCFTRTLTEAQHNLFTEFEELGIPIAKIRENAVYKAGFTDALSIMTGL